MYGLNEVFIFLISFLTFWSLIYILSKRVLLKRHRLSIQPFFIKWELNSFREFLYKCSSRWGRIWRVFSWISVFIGVGLTFFALAFLSWNIIRASLLYERVSSVTLVIPGVTFKLYWLPYFLIATIITVFLHEAAHGIVALNEGVSIKSSGALLLAIFFGGFVELDEEKLDESSYTARLKIFSAGSASNILCGLIIFLLLSGLFIQSPSGLIILEMIEGGPLQRAGIRSWDIIYALDGREIRTMQDLIDFMSNVRPWEEITVRTGRGNFIVTAEPSPEEGGRAIIGLVSSLIYYPSRLGLGYLLDAQLYLILNWLFIVLISVAIFNMLPIPYLDGDRLLQCLLEKFPRGRILLKNIFNALSIFLFLINIIISSV
ncbi:MAG: site-2 protease family protein [Candidatus Bathyarchaeia archaeon]